MNISKIIPFNIRVKTLYWVRKEKEINSDLSLLFSKIDNNDYVEGKLLLENLKNKWIEFSQKSPEWFQLEYISQFSRAESMLYFLTTNYDEEHIWTDDEVIDFVNWYIKLNKLDFKYTLENRTIIESFKNGDVFSKWYSK